MIFFPQMTSRMGWMIMPDVKNSAGGSIKRLGDIYVANNGHTYGFELISEASREQLLGNHKNQTMKNKMSLSLKKVLVVNFLKSSPEERPEWWFPADDVDISVIHVLVPQS